MTCPKCNSKDLRVLSKHMSDDFSEIKFTWKCNVCGTVFKRDYSEKMKNMNEKIGDKK